MQEVKRDPTHPEVRRFGLVVACGFAVIGGLLWYFGRGDQTGLGWAASGKQWAAVGLGTLGALVCAITLASPAAGRPIYVVWMTGATYLGMAVTFILLSILFVVFVPVFSLIRFKDPLRLKLDKDGESYWEDHVHHESTLERTARLF